MNKCCNDYPYWWNYCESTSLNQFVTHSELEEALENISGGCDCEEAIEAISGAVSAHIENNDIHVTSQEKEAWNAKLDASAYTQVDISGITTQIGALQAAVISLNDKVRLLESALTECCSGYTPDPDPEPTPDTGDTPTVDGKALLYLIGGETREISGSGFINLADTFPEGGQELVERVIIGNSVYGIGIEAFSGCTNMTAVTLNEGLETIGVDSFNGCSGLTEITIPSTVEHLTDTCFDGVTFETMTFLPTTPPAFNYGDYTSLPVIGYIYVPDESVSTYQTAWPNLANKIQGIDASNGTGGGSGGIGD